jgi:hypothetical protein
MFFEDAMGTICVELPSGWTYNPFDSTLTDFYFTPWDRGGELVVVHVRPSFIAPEQPDEEWTARVQSVLGQVSVCGILLLQSMGVSSNGGARI